ncbi:MAG TPA: tRNA pseudouridine(55) synthase TruB [Candidatus Binataceae bacterium]|nr:tRNA pseudouridine(55) synthase TruB [Candidatus Binataceae bacterium]
MHGVLLVDKPPGVGSAQVVRAIKRVVRPYRVGHLGTLDPFATGLLPILIGEATKLAPFLESSHKQYEGIIALGAETDSCDRTGQVVATAPVPRLDRAGVAAVAKQFIGEIRQVPPIFSALKRAGVPLYKLARRGEPVEPPPPRVVRIEALELDLVDFNHLRVSLICSPGTYVRTLARDIGLALGTMAHLVQLRRLATAGFVVVHAHRLEELMEAPEQLSQHVIPMAEALSKMARVEVDEESERRLRHGDASALIPSIGAREGLFMAVRGSELIAIAQCSGADGLRLLRVFVR